MKEPMMIPDDMNVLLKKYDYECSFAEENGKKTLALTSYLLDLQPKNGSAQTNYPCTHVNK